MFQAMRQLLNDLFNKNGSKSSIERQRRSRHEARKNRRNIRHERSTRQNKYGTPRPNYNECRRRSVIHHDISDFAAGESDARRLHARNTPQPYENALARKSINRHRISKPIIAHNKLSKNKGSTFLASLKRVFSSEEEDLLKLKETCDNITKIIPHNKHLRSDEQSIIRNRVVQSEAFKRKLKEIQYDKTLLQQLQGTKLVDDISTKKNYNKNVSGNISDDRVFLLVEKNRELNQTLNETTKELNIIKKNLRFANEKIRLLQSLLSDVDDDHVIWDKKRDVTDNYPKLTSRKENADATARGRNENQRRYNNLSDNKIYKNDFDSFPHSVNETQKRNNDSLSPIRIDFTKYSDIT
ncbi:Nbp1p NDAI_0D00130 [Naumovozyma dairenensis CBS 421]|uniref:Uncharacterized protein n=1 Tax=Naumovozyma dairenensis (strain ATCC 10597 / BCRC 20456 / CBS 421 / NBRC 0211 / NRRL Y-12639) TaxID=1071378 RepID=G0W966_NAUDC|nr:hypothetical protein NDAI_0D00130 [Naumovozyma dairenensis CBS 421]CCD24327.1 hypothetical protein NDAI_0D00130 [Naumovozyma dairenensis CBS 421]